MSLAKPQAGYTVSAESIPAMGPMSERGWECMSVMHLLNKFDMKRTNTSPTGIVFRCREILCNACHGLSRRLPVRVGVSLSVTSERLGHDLDIGVVAGDERGIDERMWRSSDGQGLVLGNDSWIWRWSVVHLSV